MQHTPSTLLKRALQVLDHFVIDLPSYWNHSTSPATTVQQQHGKHSIDAPHAKLQTSDSYTVDMVHIVEAENEVLCERSPVTTESKIDPTLEMSCIVSNTVDSSTGSKCLGFSSSSRRMTRSLTKLHNTTNSFLPLNDISNLEDIHITPKCSDPSSNMSVGVTDVNYNIVLVKTNMKGCRNKMRNRVDIPQKEGVPATHGTSSKEAVMNRNMSKTKLPVKRKLITSPKSDKATSSRIMTRNMSKTKLPVKRKLITSPKSDKSTSLMVKEGSEEQYGSANILSIEYFSGKKSRSGRVLLPPLEFWRNQKVIYDEDGEVCGVQEPKRQP